MALPRFEEWCKRYDELRNIVSTTIENSDLLDILMFNEVVKHDILTGMKRVSDGGFKKKDVKEFKKRLQKFNKTIMEN